MENVITEISCNSYLKMELVETRQLVPYIPENDKTPIWDGEVYVYSNKDICNDNIYGCVPVQLKAHRVKSFTSSQQIYKSDLKKYLIKDSIMFFSCQINEKDEKRVYYKIFHKLDLKKELNSFGDNDSKSFTLNKFPKNKLEIIKLFTKFVDDKEKHKNMLPNVLSLQDLYNSKGCVPVRIDMKIKKGDSLQKIVQRIEKEKPLLQYYSQDTKLFYVVDQVVVKDLCAIEKRKISIGVNGTKYFKDVELVTTKNEVKIVCNDCLYLKLEKQQIIFNYKFGKDFLISLQNFNFLYDVYKEKKLTLNGKELNPNKPIVFPEDNHIVLLHEFLNKLDRILKRLKINKCPDLSDCNYEDIEFVDKLYEAVVNNKPILEPAIKNDFYTFKFFDLVICIYFEYKDNVCYIKSWDEADKNIVFCFGNEKDRLELPSVFMLSIRDENPFLKINNLNFDLILEKIFSLDMNTFIEVAISHLLLNLINAYDINSNNDYLDYALKISEKLYNLDSNENNLINLLQIQKRCNRINDKLFNKLESIISEKDHALNCCIYILLGNKESFKNEYNLLTNNEKAEFETWPINNLLKSI